MVWKVLGEVEQCLKLVLNLARQSVKRRIILGGVRSYHFKILRLEQRCQSWHWGGRGMISGLEA